MGGAAQYPPNTYFIPLTYVLVLIREQKNVFAMITYFFIEKRRRSDEKRMEYNNQTHPLLDPCSPSCRQYCAPKYTRDERLQINNDFWSLLFERKRLWFDGLSPVAQRKVQGQTFI